MEREVTRNTSKTAREKGKPQRQLVAQVIFGHLNVAAIKFIEIPS